VDRALSIHRVAIHRVATIERGHGGCRKRHPPYTAGSGDRLSPCHSAIHKARPSAGFFVGEGITCRGVGWIALYRSTGWRSTGWRSTGWRPSSEAMVDVESDIHPTQAGSGDRLSPCHSAIHKNPAMCRVFCWRRITCRGVGWIALYRSTGGVMGDVESDIHPTQASEPRVLSRTQQKSPGINRGFEFGSATWTRTRDPMINSHLLYRLSYRGTTARMLLIQKRKSTGFCRLPWLSTPT
jgi:hypothetical protein